MRPARYPGAALFKWLKIANAHGGISARQLHHVLPYLARYLLFEPGRIYESIRYDKSVTSHHLQVDPVFVLGHWRSGTSFLQELLNLDDRHATCSLFQCLFPECALSTQAWLPGLIDQMASTFGIRYPIQDVPLRSALPAEEEIAMMCLTDEASSNWGQIFPSRMRQHFDDTDAWIDGYRFIVNKLSIAHDNRRLILKSPMNTARLPILKATYPNAAFIHIHRHPLDVFASSRRLWGMIMRQSALQKLATDEIDQLILDVYEYIMRRYLDDRGSTPPNRIIDVRYENLKANPVGVLAEIYAYLDLGEVPEISINEFVQDTPAPGIKPRSIETEMEQRIRSQWGFAFAAWNYD